MDNEVKVETKKKGNGLFTLFACIMTGVIVFLATNIGQKASKTVDPDTPKKNEVTSNVESNVTSNVTSNIESNVTSNITVTKLSEAEALTTGKSLYTQAASVYPTNGVIIDDSCTHDETNNYDCTALYNKIKNIFATNNMVNNTTSTAATGESKNIYDYFTLNNGKYMAKEGGIGVTCTTTTTLAVKTIEENKITYTATRVSAESTVVDDFEIVKENGTWKVSKFIYTACANTLK